MKNVHIRTPLVSVKNWAAWAPGLISNEDWMAWSQNPLLPSGADKIQATMIPPMIKRRCSHLSKMALEVSGRAMENHAIDYALFCSQHGEIHSSVKLLKEITDKTILSPTNFSQSVHNTSAGLFSVIYKLQQNMSSIAAGDKTFLMGTIEAVAWLKLNPGKTILLAMFDEQLPDEYQCLKIKNNLTYAMSFILSNKQVNAPAISLSLSALDEVVDDKELPQALEFLAWFLRPTKEALIQNFNQQVVKWCKHE